MHKVYRWIDVYVCVDVWLYMLYIYVCGHVCICLCFLLFICIKKMCVLKRIHKVQDNFFGYGLHLDICFFCVEGLLLFFYECECRCLCWFVWVLHVSVSCECFVWILCLYVYKFVRLFVCMFVCLGLTFVYDGFNNFMMVILALHFACWHYCC